MLELSLMLLPVAAASGWYVAYKHYTKNRNTANLDHAKYFKGLNYLINEQSDKAIDVFVNLLEIDDETIEVHLALGTLFRKRGEVEKAIRLHQNLIARPELNQLTRSEILNELGMDYMHAGLLDRAEALFLELEQHNQHKLNVVKQLLSIYQQEKEWERAITYAVKLESLKPKTQHILLAHLHCEMAINFAADNHVKEAKSYLKKALKFDPKCVRSNVIAAKMSMANSEYKSALKYLLEIKQQNILFVAVFLDMYIECFEKLNKHKELLNFLVSIESEIESPLVTKELVSLLAVQKGSEQAYAFVKSRLEVQSSISDLALFSDLIEAEEMNVETKLLYQTIEKSYKTQQLFHCEQCGFDSEVLNWMCPSCKSWGIVQPVIFSSI